MAWENRSQEEEDRLFASSGPNSSQDEPVEPIDWPLDMTPDGRVEVLKKVRAAFWSFKENYPDNVVGDDYIVFSTEIISDGVIRHGMTVRNVAMMFAPLIYRLHKPFAGGEFSDELDIGRLDIHVFANHSRDYKFGVEGRIYEANSFFHVLVGLQD